MLDPECNDWISELCVITKFKMTTTAMNSFKTNLVSILFSIPCLAFAQNHVQVPKLGDVSDGNRSVPVHLIDLYDADSILVRPGDQPMLPFSTKVTCGECHNYEKVRMGWHFNAAEVNVEPGRRGQPWILVDQKTGTQLPLSYRPWPGAYKPEQLGMDSWRFVQAFGRHTPGGGIGENTEADAPELFFRRLISGALEINCLSCHDAEAGHDQAEYANNLKRENFRWAAASTSGFATVRGAAKDVPDNYDIYSGLPMDDPKLTAPSVSYDLSRFNARGKVLFDIVRKIPNERCYFCHSTKTVGVTDRWEAEEDIHLTSGMLCVDCHRNGLDHNMVRGYEDEPQVKKNPLAASLSCQGCHLPDESNEVPVAGRLGAPQPKHAGIPLVHFEKMTCTACHAGSWPVEKTQLVKTSQAHALGTHSVNRSDLMLPHIAAPVFVREENGKIAPHKMIWPAFWARLNGKNVAPIAPAEVAAIADTLFAGVDSARSGDWLTLQDEPITQVLQRLAAADSSKSEAAYIAGGKLYRLNRSGKLSKENHAAAQPYSWAIGHDVRPASQSLGIRGCGDCHSLNAPIYFSQLKVDSPLETDRHSTYKAMTDFAGLSGIYARLFAVSFFFRPLLKLLLLAGSAALIGVLLWNGLQGLGSIMKAAAELKENSK
jgi:hypothetical protein